MLHLVTHPEITHEWISLGQIAPTQTTRTLHPAIGYRTEIGDLGHATGDAIVSSGTVIVDADGTGTFVPAVTLDRVAASQAVDAVVQIALRFPGELHRYEAENLEHAIVWAS